jgi:hypothetical protein
MGLFSTVESQVTLILFLGILGVIGCGSRGISAIRSSRAGNGGFSADRAMKWCWCTMVKTRGMRRREAYK